MPTLTIMRGISGSGKSTMAERMPGVKVSRDRIRLAFFGSDGEDYYRRPTLSEDEEAVTEIHDSVVCRMLLIGRDVVIDNTNIEWKYVEHFARLARASGAEVSIVLVDVPLQTALTRNFERRERGGRFVPEHVIENQYHRLQRTKHYKLKE